MLALLTISNCLSAAEPAEKDAVAMSERGAAFYKDHGRAELAKHVTERDPRFVQGSMYIYVRDLATGKVLAHPYNQSIVGKDLNDVPDNNGKYFRRDIYDLARKDGTGWVDYVYRDPSNGKFEQKTSYVQRVGDVILVTGVYKR